eukprot:CAMPEP_0184646682 /NCGR_PEP_ID=MMETSP0308-20130426/3420_1 /TAXON_ID=38269 /ORGANISM="Gloeochaete witrockiana, Strain SAG 46.84" /LENGTH=644 /DNA_ID=CAMNT_0027076925 /DNA_START=63 /DNA_END=1997 /DNA_ORIENTATION=-
MPRKGTKKKAAVESDEEASLIFENLHFYVNKDVHDPDLADSIKEHGGSIVRTNNKKVTHFICEQGLEKSTVGVFYVTPAFIKESISLGVKQDEKDYAAPYVAAKSTGKKRKGKKDADSDSETEDQPIKSTKAKPDPAKSAVAKTKKNTRANVDLHCPMRSSTHVYIDDEGTAYDLMLNQTDVTFGVQGHNKFYVCQLLVPNIPTGAWYVFTRWGRVGVPGQNKNQKFESFESAMMEFEKKFKDKTGNLWEHRDDFVFQNGKYDMVEIDHGAAAEDEAPADSALVEVPKKQKLAANSSLDQRLQTLIELISSHKIMESTLQEMEIDLKKMPLGKLTKKQIREGYEILSQLEEVLKGRGDGEQTVEDLTNRFYSKIPHDFGRRRPTLINSLVVLKAKMEVLEALGDIEIAQSMIKVKKEEENVHQLDSIYASLNCTVQPLPKDHETYKMIVKMVENTHAPTHSSYTLEVVDVFEVERKEEKPRYEPFKKLHNRQLLWHGSRVTNFMGILSQGLRIAPPEAPHAGYMFGKGIYFADMVSKSANYCACNRNQDSGLLLLGEVALGDALELEQAQYIEQLPSKKHSTKGWGKTIPDPKGAVTLPGGIVAHLGKPIGSDHQKSVLQYNEMIVYSVNQVLLRYLVFVRFKY